MSMIGARRAIVAAILLGAIGCDPGVEEPDAARARRDAFIGPDTNIDAWGPDAGMISCGEDNDCDDGVDCNGIETCSGRLCALGPAPSCADEIACTIDLCDLSVGDCVHRAPDADGDGFGDARCVDARGERLGTDCDDSDDRRFPGNLEICDIAGLDEDCDLNTRGGLDADLDGVEDARCCNPMRTTDTRPNCGLDCLDSARSVNPMGTETCNGIDDNCDGVVDEICICNPGITRPCVAGGVCAAGVETCTNGLVWSMCSIAAEPTDVCNGLDEDCDGRVDEGVAIECWRDVDNDRFAPAGRASERRCSDPDRTMVGGCPVDYTNRPPLDAASSDCCDRDARAHPGQVNYFNIASFCTGFDFDCDGAATREFTLLAAPTGRCIYPTETTCNAASDLSGWLEGVPGCGVGGTQLTGCFWFPSGLGPACTFTPAGEIQSCR